MNRLGLALGSLSLGLLSGCANLPDLQLAKQAKSEGDLATAEANFRGLADRGYVDGQIGLADILARSTSPERQAQAESLYRQAQEHSSVAAVRLGKWLANKPQPTLDERVEAERLLREGLATGDRSVLLPLVKLQLLDPQRMNSGEIDEELARWQMQGLGEAQLGRIMLYRARGDYTQHLPEIRRTCEAWLAQVSECYAELAAIYQKQGDAAARTALLEQLQTAYQSGAVPPEQMLMVGRALADPANGEPDPQAAKALLEWVAPVYANAWVSLAELTLGYPALGNAGDAVGYLEQGVAAGSARAALTLGQLYLKGREIPGDPQAAEKYLLQALPGEPKAHFFLGKLYGEGQLGDIDPDKALEHLLIAARGGNASADVALAHLFGSGKGVRINRVYAYSFASLAVSQGLPQGQVLMERLAPQLTPEERDQAEQLLRREQRTRSHEQLSAQHSTQSMQGML